MPNLQLEAVHHFWDDYDRKTLYRVITAIEQVENWASDVDPAIDRALLHLGEALEQANGVEVDTLERPFIQMLSAIRASRAMRILQFIDQIKPGNASSLLMYAEELAEKTDQKTENKEAKRFLRRNLVFERLQLLSRVFSPQRIAIVLKALEKQTIQQ